MENSPIKIPPPLPNGAVIGIAAPSGNVRGRDGFEEGIRILHELGFATKFPRELWPGHHYLADTDSRRAEELVSLWKDNDVDCIMAARGGYGCLRILRSLRDDALGGKGKRLVGFSDVTLLHQLLNTRHNLVSLHGPVVTSLARLSRESLMSFKHCLLGALEGWQMHADVEVLRGSGVTRGMSAGGNLSTIASTLGTELAPYWRDKIVFLEDTGESAYRIDRMLTQLHLSGAFEGVAAIVLGDFVHGLDIDGVSRHRHQEAIWQRVMQLADEDTVLWSGFPIGHGSDNHTFPMGLQLTLDHGSRMLSACLEEP